MSTWLVPREDMTPEQLRAIELSPNEHRVIFGAPGSGKTQILLHRARYLADMHRVKPERLHIFVFTNVLKEYIGSALRLLNLPADCVTTLDAWCREYYEKNIDRKVPWNRQAKCPDFALIRQRVLEKASMSLFSDPIYDFLLVDEAQDLDRQSFDLLKTISKHVTVCMDHKQQIYEQGSDEADILRMLGLRKRNMSLLEAFRCCPYIVDLSAELVDDPEDKVSYVRQVKVPQMEKETPVLYYADSFDAERSRLMEVLRIRQAKGERIGILLPQKRQVYGFAKGMREAGLEVETPSDWSNPDGLDFNNDLPKIMSYHSAKGLTFDTVLMPRLVPASFSKLSQSRIDRLLFVGITRATKWVFMSTIHDSPLPSIERLKPLASRGCLTIQDGSQLPSQTTGSTATHHTKKDDDDLLDLL